MNRRDLLRRMAAGAAMLAVGVAPKAAAARRAPARCGTARCGNVAYGHDGMSDSDRIEWRLNNPPEDGIVWIPPGVYALDRTISILPGDVSPTLKAVVIRHSWLEFRKGVETGMLLDAGPNGASVDARESRILSHWPPQPWVAIRMVFP